MIEPTRAGAKAREALASFDAAFADFYPEAYAAWIAGGNRPAMLCDLPARLARVATDRGARGAAVVLLSGMRLDAWWRLRARVLPRVPGLALIEEGLHWAARPTVPAVQRELVARGLTALATGLPRRDEPAPPRTLEEALRPRREHLGRHEVLRIDAYAAALAMHDAPPAVAFARVEQALSPALLTLCGSFPARTVLALAADVGASHVTRRADDGSNEASNSLIYGGDSAFEAIVPYAFLTWG